MTTQQKKYILLIILFSLFIPQFGNADLLPEPDQKRVDSCTKIVNRSAYPDIQILAHQYSPLGDDEIYPIQDNSCIKPPKMMYKHNTIELYWNPLGENGIHEERLLQRNVKHGLKLIDKTNPLKHIVYNYYINKEGDGYTLTLDTVFEYEEKETQQEEKSTPPKKVKDNKKKNQKVTKNKEIKQQKEVQEEKEKITKEGKLQEKENAIKEENMMEIPIQKRGITQRIFFFFTDIFSYLFN